jgi:GT2 family glycosyltransferase/glycosyltransferase involved in cell wall biosynthesis/SAM-dependent methyltransferase
MAFPGRRLLGRARAGVAVRAEVLLRRAYLALPISSRHRWTIKGWGFRLTAGLMRGTASYQRWEATHRRAGMARQPRAPLPVSDVAGHLKALSLGLSDAPEVSVIIPVFGQLDETLRCLASIGRALPARAFEVIVVDDGSPDATAATLATIPGLRVVSTEVNVGFIRSCNLGARHALGRYLLFLNNDTEVMPGWCDELIGTFVVRPDAGVVGAQLLYPDGRLQEAGGIIWRDGSGWNYGREQDPAQPEFNYRRDVDYVSGAVLAITRDLFDRVGGFDERYLPAYGEDSDLAFKVRELGLAVLYQPMARVIHREGATGGTDVSQGPKAHQGINAEKLFDRWRTRLEAHHVPGTQVSRARERNVGFRVLVMDHCTPEPNRDAGSITALNLMRLLQQTGARVTFVPEDNFLFLPGYTTDMQRLGIECLYAPHVTSVDDYLREHGDLFDLVIIFRFTAARRRLASVRRWCPRARVVLHTSDLHFLRLERQAALTSDDILAAGAARTREDEVAVIQAVDATIVHSPVERDLLADAVPAATVHVFGWAIELVGTRAPFESRSNIMFLGGYQHPPNVDAALYFVHDILPRVRQRLPDVVLHLVGSNPPEAVRALASDAVHVAGFVENLSAHADQIRLAVAPIRYGAGIKGKVVTTMNLGLPNVMTTIAAEGLGIRAGVDALVADSPEGFADAVVRLYTDQDLWQHLSATGMEVVKERFSFDAGLRTVEDLLRSLDIEPRTVTNSRNPGVPTGDLDVSRFPNLAAYQEQIVESAAHLAVRAEAESALIPSGPPAPFVIEGFCIACVAPASFRVGYEYAHRDRSGRRLPNWREHLVCSCGLNARTRAVVHVLTELCGATSASDVYLMEQASPLHHVCARRHRRLVASAFVDPALAPGAVVDGLRHEDATRLSFADASLDYIVSCDVLEHVPDYRKAFAECARTLRPGGQLLLTVPFLMHGPTTVVRSRVTASGAVEHLLPPEYHGDPRQPDAGILCFQHFGWDALDDLTSAGFRSAELLLLWSRTFGYLGGGEIILRALK